MKMLRTLTLLAFVAFVLASTANVLTADWSPQAAARYLDERQKQWFEWKPAASANGPCVSCHTGMPYLLARPVLRRALKEDQPTVYERGLMDRLRANVGSKPPGGLQDVEVIFAAMFLAQQDARRAMSEPTQKAFAQLWALQRTEAPAKGAWKWYAANLDPWEHSGSSYFGASLAMLALGATSADYQQRADTRERASALSDFLAASRRPSATRSAGSVVGVVNAPVGLVRCATCGAHRRGLRETAGGRGMDVGVAGSVDRASRCAIGHWQRVLCDELYRIRARSGGHSTFARWIVSGTCVAPLASGPNDRRVASGVHEQAPACRLHGSAVHAGRSDRVCVARAPRTHAVASDVSCGVSRQWSTACQAQLSGMRTHSLLTKLR